jgi:putative transport protein
MELDFLLQFLHKESAFTLFLLLAGGFFFGNISIFGFKPGSVAGVLFVSLFFGYFGFTITPGAQSVGFALFIFSVGYQAGPQFIDVLRTDGLKYLSLAAVVALAGCSVAFLCGYFGGLPPGAAAGVLSGGLTSSPTLAAAQEAVRSGLVTPPAGTSIETMLSAVGSAYAITYIFGLIGLILMIGVLPRVLKIDLKAEARKMEQKSSRPYSVRPQMRAYRVENQELCSMTIREVSERIWDGLSLAKLRREGEIIEFDPDGHLQLDDELIVLGDRAMFMKGMINLGREIEIPAQMEFYEASATLIVANPKVIGCRLGDVSLAGDYGLVVTEITRDNLSLPVNPFHELQRGDIISVVGLRSGIDKLEGVMGPVEADIVATDMLAFALGIAAGVLLGQITITVAGVPLGLGMAGGLLTTGIVVGVVNSTRPHIGKFPAAARWVLMEFGLLIFIAAVGLRVGGSIIETLVQSGPLLIGSGILTTLISLLIGYLFGSKVLKLTPVLLFGALAGALTSGAALSIVTREAKSSAPALGYTGTYAFANIILSIAGTLMVLL